MSTLGPLYLLFPLCTELWLFVRFLTWQPVTPSLSSALSCFTALLRGSCQPSCPSVLSVEPTCNGCVRQKPYLEPRQQDARASSPTLIPEAEWRWGWNCTFGPDCDCSFVSLQKDEMLPCVQGRISKDVKWEPEISKCFRGQSLCQWHRDKTARGKVTLSS